MKMILQYKKTIVKILGIIRKIAQLFKVSRTFRIFKADLT